MQIRRAARHRPRNVPSMPRTPWWEVMQQEKKQGLLAPVLLGEVFPLEDGSPDPVRQIIQRFASDYEEFKNSSWQIL